MHGRIRRTKISATPAGRVPNLQVQPSHNKPAKAVQEGKTARAEKGSVSFQEGLVPASSPLAQQRNAAAARAVGSPIASTNRVKGGATGEGAKGEAAKEGAGKAAGEQEQKQVEVGGCDGLPGLNNQLLPAFNNGFLPIQGCSKNLRLEVASSICPRRMSPPSSVFLGGRP